jgi:hypothetical protein
VLITYPLHYVEKPGQLTMTGYPIVASLDGDMRGILPFHEGSLWRQFPSVEFGDGLHPAEVSLAAGHPSRI